MNIRVFCYFGLLKDPDRLSSLTSLLPDDLKPECERLIEEGRQKEPEALRAEWNTIRQSERKTLVRDAERTLGGRLSALPPELQRHLLWRAARD